MLELELNGLILNHLISLLNHFKEINRPKDKRLWLPEGGKLSIGTGHKWTFQGFVNKLPQQDIRGVSIWISYCDNLAIYEGRVESMGKVAKDITYDEMKQVYLCETFRPKK